MQFKALLLASLAACVLADSTSTDTRSTSMESRTDSDSKMSHSTSDRSESAHVESGYALTTDASGSTIATYTGTDTKKPRTTSVPTALAAATSDHSSSHKSSSATSSSSKSATSSHNMAMATGIPLIGAAAMAGIAFVI